MNFAHGTLKCPSQIFRGRRVHRNVMSCYFVCHGELNFLDSPHCKITLDYSQYCVALVERQLFPYSSPGVNVRSSEKREGD
jgi:hypothetical protein